MNTQVQTEVPVQTPQKALSLKVFGIGTAGVNVIEQVLTGAPSGAAFVVLNTDAQSLAASTAPEKVHLETKLMRGMGTGGDPERGRALAEEHLPKLSPLWRGADVVCLVAGLGGGAGTGISPVVARAARESGALVLAFVILPFDCEGTLRSQVAQAGLARLKEAADLVVCLPNQKAFALINEATSLLDTFRASNELLGACVRSALLALTSQSVMGLPFTDLCFLVRQRSSDCVFAVAEAAGPSRSAEALERLLAHPMLEGADFLSEAEAAAVCVMGGTDLAMVEVNRIMDQIHSRCKESPVLMGALVSPELSKRLIVSLLVARPEPAAPAEAESEQPASETPLSQRASGDLNEHLVNRSSPARPQSRCVPPPPAVTPERLEQLQMRQTRSRKASSRLRQGQLPLEIISKGRFDKSEPTIHKGEDLDVPTYIRRGISLN
jgi:cell division protein FtsZ